MKIKDELILREVAGETIVIPTGETLDLNMMITLNETGAFLWKQLEQETTEDTVVAALLSEYDLDEASARTHVAAFVAKLKKHDFLA